MHIINTLKRKLKTSPKKLLVASAFVLLQSKRHLPQHLIATVRQTRLTMPTVMVVVALLHQPNWLPTLRQTSPVTYRTFTQALV
jgi:hypothetical protein